MHTEHSPQGPHFIRRELSRCSRELLQLLDAPDAELRHVAAWVSRHDLLAAALIRAANSPENRLRREVRDVRHAVTLLGLRGLATFARRHARPTRDATVRH